MATLPIANLLRAALVAGALASGVQAQRADAPSSTDTTLPVKTERRTRVRLGGIYVSGGYAHHSGGPYGYYAPYYWWYHPWHWDPWLWSPLYYWPAYHPGYFTGFAYAPNLGEVKLKTECHDAEVLVNGAYAGTARERKSMWLEPGAYDIEIALAGYEPFKKRIYVLSGRTLTLAAALEPAQQEVPEP